MLESAVIEDLRNNGLIGDRCPRVEALAGGVSSDVLLIESGESRFVLKRALPKLRVSDPWYADVSRNETEFDCLEFLASILPDAVPEPLHRNPRLNYFCMEYLGSGYANYKKLLLAGSHQQTVARRAAHILAMLHRRSWCNERVAAQFATTEQFWSLRLDPYLVTAARRNPAVNGAMTNEAQRIAATRLALVQGDFSPKNILVHRSRVVILDCEAAWYGEPAFDVAFFLNHFMLKAIHMPQRRSRLLTLAEQAWQSYQQTLGAPHVNAMDGRIANLLPMLMLARVDGKSTVEYLCDDRKRALVREFAHQQILERDHGLLDCIQEWRETLQILDQALIHENPIR